MIQTLTERCWGNGKAKKLYIHAGKYDLYTDFHMVHSALEKIMVGIVRHLYYFLLKIYSVTLPNDYITIINQRLNVT